MRDHARTVTFRSAPGLSAAMPFAFQDTTDIPPFRISTHLQGNPEYADPRPDLE
jgi:hypothetical protein